MKITVGEIIDNAIQKCGLLTPSESPEQLLRAKQNLNFVLMDMMNRGVPIFAVTPLLIGLQPSKWIYDVDTNIIDVFNLNWRQFHHPLCTVTGGVNPANLQDYNWLTYSTTLNTFTLTPSSVPIFIDYFGFVPFGDQTASFVIEVQIDNVNNIWQTAKTYTDFDLIDQEWTWFDMTTPIYGYAVRLRLTGSSTSISLRGFFTGNRQNAYEQPAFKMNRDDFFFYPTKGIQGIPINYYFLKDTQPQIQLWQSTNGANLFNWCLSLYVFKFPELDLKLPLSLDVPFWYYEGIEWTLAAKLIYMLPGVDPAKIAVVEAKAQEMLSAMEAANSDTTGINLLGGMLSQYQRRT